MSLDRLRNKILNMQPASGIGWVGESRNGVCNLVHGETGEFHDNISRKEADSIVGDQGCRWINITVRPKVE